MPTAAAQCTALVSHLLVIHTKTNVKTTAEVTRPKQAVNEFPLACHNEPSHYVLSCWMDAGGDAADPHPWLTARATT